MDSCAACTLDIIDNAVTGVQHTVMWHFHTATYLTEYLWVRLGTAYLCGCNDVIQKACKPEFGAEML
jgi:hypothetical protein